MKKFKIEPIILREFYDHKTQKLIPRYYQRVLVKSSLEAFKYTLDSVFYGDSESEVMEKVKNYTKQ